MKYILQSDDYHIDLVHRLLKIRNISDNVQDFFSPSFATYRTDSSLLHDFDIGIDRIVQAITNQEKIAIFGDYDADGISSVWVLYMFIRRTLGYDNISLRLPNRLEDGYGIKSYHLDELKEKGVSLVITVDNGITCIDEAKHAKNIGIDMVITDHHKQLESIPDAVAVINPQISHDYPFKEICGAGVAFKVVVGLMKKLQFTKQHMSEVIRFILPVVAIGTVADCMPLVGENRLFVKLGLEYLNSRVGVPQSLLGFIDYLGIKQEVDSMHIGYVIGPRINAGGRMVSPYDSLWILLTTGQKQLQYLDRIDELNTQRRQTQEAMFKLAEGQIDIDNFLLVAGGEDFHEGVVGIVSGRLTERYYRPSMVYKCDTERGCIVASLRGPGYFSVIDMLRQAGHLLDRYGGHQQAGGLTVQIDKFDEVCQIFSSHCIDTYAALTLEKEYLIDTVVLPHEMKFDVVKSIMQLAPFGEGNPEPVFAWPDAQIIAIRKVGQRGNGHLKFTFSYGGVVFDALRWSKGSRIAEFAIDQVWTLIGTFKIEGGSHRYVVVDDLVEKIG